MSILKTMYNSRTVQKIKKRKYPGIWVVETTNRCNIRCVGCDNKIMKRKKGNMTEKEFEHILKQLKGVGAYHIDLDLGGEPLMNPDTLKIAKMCTDAGITTFFPTNGMLLDKRQQEIFDSGLTYMLIDLDGTTKEAYEAFRCGSNFEKVVENTKNFLKAKKDGKYKTPYTSIGFLVTKFNEHQLDEMKEWYKELGADNLVVKTLHLMLKEGEQLKDSLLPENKEYSRYADDDRSTYLCPSISKKGTIHWNGDIGLCSCDIKGEYIFGNIFETPLKEILDSPEYEQRKADIEKRKFDLCKSCVVIQRSRKSDYQIYGGGWMDSLKRLLK